MSEPEKPKKRPFWQLHLSTALVLMILTGGLIGIVCHFHFENLPKRQDNPDGSNYLQALVNYYFGFALGIIGSIVLVVFVAVVCEAVARDREARRQ
jgi:hypothetical protein